MAKVWASAVSFTVEVRLCFITDTDFSFLNAFLTCHRHSISFNATFQMSGTDSNSLWCCQNGIRILQLQQRMSWLQSGEWDFELC